MTEKQKLWAHFYETIGDATLAAKVAGYENPTSAGNRNLENEEVRRYREEWRKNNVAQAMEVVEFLSTVMRGMQDGEGKNTVSGREQLRAAELLAKRYGLLNEREEEKVDSIKVVVEYK